MKSPRKRQSGSTFLLTRSPELPTFISPRHAQRDLGYHADLFKEVLKGLKSASKIYRRIKQYDHASSIKGFMLGAFGAYAYQETRPFPEVWAAVPGNLSFLEMTGQFGEDSVEKIWLRSMAGEYVLGAYQMLHNAGRSCQSAMDVAKALEVLMLEDLGLDGETVEQGEVDVYQ
ncbi:hypothetical protein BAUCODRAFT_506145 [Baudoinia panamericana UAMH 10762]|uniref:Uncharacterized protein n=1 Tax=Baudoinia panamericana (strain UAMH 10762) TaxID=717646 RepID=M2LNB4_BAUPA|nr:uncharacterized protein BAUCODRAFT_506145 [Baudoinia panamericana UAMH 10762]EMC95842.1 hypothetical protein BAUCODRAFT_506145 [Baudoinia panamericana UAMH 10762]